MAATAALDVCEVSLTQQDRAFDLMLRREGRYDLQKPETEQGDDSPFQIATNLDAPEDENWDNHMYNVEDNI